MENYRPISLLPSFSKLFELAMCRRLMDFLNKCNILNKHQHGYLPGKSTQTAIFQFTTAILKHLENNNLSLGICLDLSKAYDCIDRDLLVKKLNLYGIRGNALKLFESYLSNRTQRVKMHKNKKSYISNTQVNPVGIAQGSIAGPILFIIYVNDLNFIADNKNELVTCYADDTNLLVQGKNLTELTNNGEYLFTKANEWFLKNKLILNKTKTNSILFRTKLCRLQAPSSLSVRDNNLSIVNNTKFLGLYIDEYLDWSVHLNHLINKLNSICYGVRVVGRYMS